MISVVIPLYNKRSSILSTVQSVMDQTYGDFELIVVDDGSTDGSAGELRDIEDHRLRIVTKPNGGVCSARNEGIRAARSEYVAFLDADDLYEPDFIKEIADLIDSCPEASIWGTSYSFLKDGELIPALKPLPAGFKGIIDNSLWTLGHIYCSSAVCCRKSALEEVGLFDERITWGEDIDVWWRIMLAHPAAYSNRPLAVYRFDEDNRAMNAQIPLERLYINYFEKYSAARAACPAFRHFIDRECMWWLFPYFSKDPRNPDVRRILSQIDLGEYKRSFAFRFRHPKMYSAYQRLKKQIRK